MVSIMANWYGKGKRGLVMGIWNAHTSVGNIAGTVVAAACLQYGWGYSFVVPGVAISVMGVVVYLLLVVQPSDVGVVQVAAGAAAAPYEQLKTVDEEADGSDTVGGLCIGAKMSCLKLRCFGGWCCSDCGLRQAGCGCGFPTCVVF